VTARLEVGEDGDTDPKKVIVLSLLEDASFLSDNKSSSAVPVVRRVVDARVGEV